MIDIAIINNIQDYQCARHREGIYFALALPQQGTISQIMQDSPTLYLNGLSTYPKTLEREIKGDVVWRAKPDKPHPHYLYL